MKSPVQKGKGDRIDGEVSSFEILLNTFSLEQGKIDGEIVLDHPIGEGIHLFFSDPEEAQMEGLLHHRNEGRVLFGQGEVVVFLFVGTREPLLPSKKEIANCSTHKKERDLPLFSQLRKSGEDWVLQDFFFDDL